MNVMSNRDIIWFKVGIVVDYLPPNIYVWWCLIPSCYPPPFTIYYEKDLISYMMEITINLDRRSKKYDDPDLFQVYVRDYEENYVNPEDDIDPELVKKVKAISSRPRTLTEYYDAANIYWEYMHILYEKHGGKKLFKMKLRDGVIEEYVPPKPRPKSKEIRRLGKKGIHISERMHRNLNWTEIGMWAENHLASDDYSNIETVTKIDTKGAKRRFKVLDKYEDKNTGRNRSKGIASEFDYVDEYFAMRNIDLRRKNGKLKKAKKRKEDVTAHMISTYMRADYKDIIESTKPSDEMTIAGGVLLSSKKAETLAIYRTLAELGWDSYELMRKRGGFSKTQLKRFKKMTKKDKKKDKKKKSQVIDSSINMYLGDVLADNGYSDYEEFNADMLDCSYDNLKAQYDNRGGRSVFEKIFG